MELQAVHCAPHGQERAGGAWVGGPRGRGLFWVGGAWEASWGGSRTLDVMGNARGRGGKRVGGGLRWDSWGHAVACEAAH